MRKRSLNAGARGGEREERPTWKTTVSRARMIRSCIQDNLKTYRRTISVARSEVSASPCESEVATKLEEGKEGKVAVSSFHPPSFSSFHCCSVKLRSSTHIQVRVDEDDLNERTRRKMSAIPLPLL